MFFWIWGILGVVATGIGANMPPDPAVAPAPAVIRAVPAPGTPTAPASPLSPATPASPASPAAPARPADPGLVAEPQIPSGRFTTAVEVKPILTATKNVWIAIRDYGGQDLLYVTQIYAWRCGLLGLSVAINDGPSEPWALPPCHEDTATPNAITDSDGLPYRAYPAGSLDSVTVTLIYDDLSTDTARFTRTSVLMP